MLPPPIYTPVFGIPAKGDDATMFCTLIKVTVQAGEDGVMQILS
jgi:hypothetical protein